MVESNPATDQQMKSETSNVTSNSQVDIQKLKRLCQSVEEKRQEAKQKIYDARSDFYCAVSDTELAIKAAKAQLKEQGELEEKECVFCSYLNPDGDVPQNI